MKKSIIINVLVGLLIFFCKVNSWSQLVALGCGGERYTEEVFSAATMTTVKYGEALNYDGTIMELEMDVFQPENDTLLQRPIVVFAHSAVGDRSEMHPLCEQFSRRGYVTASISYREGDGIGQYNNYISAGIRHMQDMKAAVRFFRNDYNTDNLLKVDTNFIFVGGFSLGANMALSTAYWDEGDSLNLVIDSLISVEGGTEGNSNEFLDESSRVQGVINLSGAMLFKEWIDEEEAAIASYHGTNDQIASIGHFLFEGVFFMDGSEEIHQEAAVKNIPNYFHLVPGGGHFDIYEASFTDEYNAFKEGTFKLFKDSVLCKNTVSSIPTDGVTEQIVNIFPNPASEKLTILHDGNELVEFFIFDNLGRRLGRWTLDSSQSNLELTNFHAGIYFYFIKNEANYIQSGKLFITKK